MEIAHSKSMFSSGRGGSRKASSTFSSRLDARRGADLTLTAAEVLAMSSQNLLLVSSDEMDPLPLASGAGDAAAAGCHELQCMTHDSWALLCWCWCWCWCWCCRRGLLGAAGSAAARGDHQVPLIGQARGGPGRPEQRSRSRSLSLPLSRSLPGSQCAPSQAVVFRPAARGVARGRQHSPGRGRAPAHAAGQRRAAGVLHPKERGADTAIFVSPGAQYLFP